MIALRPRIACAAVVLCTAPSSPVAAQSLLDRPPNVSDGWVANAGTIQFNFLHRFVVSDAPVRKVTNFPTFTVGVGLPERLMVGFNYATNSTLAPRFPNEWEFFGRYALFRADRGAPLDVTGQVGYNLSAEGVDGEVTLARRVGPLRLVGAVRALSNPYEAGDVDFGAGGGATVRLSRYVALAGDAAKLPGRDSAGVKKLAWSAGLHLAIPNTPHTLSFQATNTNTTTLQGLSRGDDDVRWGFEFTVPITLARYFGRRSPPVAAAPPDAAAAAPGAVPAAGGERSGPVRSTVIRQMAFPQNRLEVEPGTTITWKNEDVLAHTVTAVDGAFDSGMIQPGDSWSYTFTTPGTYAFLCTPHPFMTGVVVVRDRS